MSEGASEEPSVSKEITFNVKSSGDSKFTVTVPETLTVLELKAKLSTSEFAAVEPTRQRLIYSGRVLKDTDQLLVYKIKDGNTVHMVKGAVSSQRQQSEAGNPNSTASGAAVPTNIQTGTGTDPLAGLTGARYAGFAQMPGADQFGPDGGMGPPQGPDDMLRMLENPMFQSQMNEAMSNPHVIQMMQNNPMVRNNPFLRQMLENPEMRRMMMDPQVIRQSMHMSRMMGRGGSDNSGMPAPGMTSTTPAAIDNRATTGGDSSATPQQTNSNGGTASPITNNPFAMFGLQGSGSDAVGSTIGQENPFAALFGNPSSTQATTGSTVGTTYDPAGQGHGTTANQTQTSSQQDPMAAMMQLMQNQERMRAALQAMDLNGASGAGPQTNPFALLAGGAGNLGSPTPSLQDTRPPEELYAEQLRQLNDMGFYEFEKNVRALRMAGGNVHGAIEVLLGGPGGADT